MFSASLNVTTVTIPLYKTAYVVIKRLNKIRTTVTFSRSSNLDWSRKSHVLIIWTSESITTYKRIER